MKAVVFHCEAEAEVRASIAYYEGQKRKLGCEYRDEVQAAVQRIRKNPKAFAVYDDQGTRKCLVKRFPYTIHFVELDDAIWIAAVAHQRRRPGYWSSRVPE
jgi:toxin ParE1/3/4